MSRKLLEAERIGSNLFAWLLRVAQRICVLYNLLIVLRSCPTIGLPVSSSPLCHPFAATCNQSQACKLNGFNVTKWATFRNCWQLIFSRLYLLISKRTKEVWIFPAITCCNHLLKQLQLVVHDMNEHCFITLQVKNNNYLSTNTLS